MTKLTDPQRRHLVEMVDVGRDAVWRPANAGESRCADRLTRRGLVQRLLYTGDDNAYALTEAGWIRGQDERAVR